LEEDLRFSTSIITSIYGDDDFELTRLYPTCLMIP